MDAELSKLEEQVELIVDLYEKLKADNRNMKARLTRLEADNRTLSDKIQMAADKLETLVDKLPEE